MRGDRRVGGLGWWKAIAGLLALALLLDFSFSALGWLGVAALLALVGLAIAVRNRLPWVTTAIETLGGLVLLIIVYLNILGRAVSGGFFRAWMPIAMYTLTAILFVVWIGVIISRRRRKRS